jgi:hypothetical protein
MFYVFLCCILLTLENKRYNFLFREKDENSINEKISIFPLNNIIYIILG